MAGKERETFVPRNLPTSGKGSGLRKAMEAAGEDMDQGWLFTPQELNIKPRQFLTDKQRYPKGFTPRRQRIVSEALKDTRVHTDGISPGDANLTGEQKNKLGRERATIIQTLARSSIPADRLANARLTDIRTNEPGIQGNSAFYRTIGPYRGIHVGDYMDRGLSHTHPTNFLGRMFTHETGHAIDRGEILNRGGTIDRSPLGKGVAEGLADHVAATRFGQDPRVPASVTPSAYHEIWRKNLEGDKNEAEFEAGKFASDGRGFTGTMGRQWLEGYDAARTGRVRVGEDHTEALQHQPTLFD